MNTSWNTALWMQFGAAIDMLENALLACPAQLWRRRLWPEQADESQPPESAEFWYLAYHALFWLDLYLSGAPEEEYAPPAPFVWTEQDSTWVLPERPYTKEELKALLAATREKCRATLIALTDERADRAVEYPWTAGKVVSYLELQLLSMRHVQEHASQLSLFLGQRAVSAVPAWISRAKKEPVSR